MCETNAKLWIYVNASPVPPDPTAVAGSLTMPKISYLQSVII